MEPLVALLGPWDGEGKTMTSESFVPVCCLEKPHIFAGPGNVGPSVRFLAMHYHFLPLGVAHLKLLLIDIHLPSDFLCYIKGIFQAA